MNYKRKLRKVTASKNTEEFYNITSLIKQTLDEEYVAFIYCNEFSNQENGLKLGIYGRQSKQCYIQFINGKKIQEFINALPKILDSKIKAVIFQVFDFKSDEFGNNIKFCNALKAKMDSAKIPYSFISGQNFTIYKLLLAANITVKVGENISMVLIRDECAGIFNLKFTSGGYSIVNEKYVEGGNAFSEIIHSDEKADWKDLREKIVLGTFDDSKKILLCVFRPQNPGLKFFQRLLKAETKKLVTVEIDEKQILGTAVVGKAEEILGKKVTKFHVIPTCARLYQLGNSFGGSDYDKFVTDTTTTLPFEKKFNFPRTTFVYYLGYSEEESPEKLIKLDSFVPPEAQHVEITLKIDVNNFPIIELRPLKVIQICNLPNRCNKALRNTKVPMIAFLDNYSFICIYDKTQKRYRFMDSWGGEFGEPSYISFEKEKPQFGKAADETFKKHGKFAVYQLIYLMSKTVEELKNHENLNGFSITSDAKNPVLIAFDAFGGEKKAATPAFLMALLLKEHIKAIKNEVGEKPNKLAFSVVNNFESDEMKRVEESLKEACDLLKIEICNFV